MFKKLIVFSLAVLVTVSPTVVWLQGADSGMGGVVVNPSDADDNDSTSDDVPLPDTDNDGIVDTLDLDDDNDGILDVDERGFDRTNFHPACSSFSMDFTGPAVLESGTDKSVGAVYRYSSVAAGIDALVTVEDIVNAYIADIDDNLSDASHFKPITGCVIPNAGDHAYVEYRIQFVLSGTTTPTVIQNFFVNFNDIDGENELSEENYANLPTSYTVEDPTDLIISDNGWVRATGPTYSNPGASNAYPEVNLAVRYIRKSELMIRVGAVAHQDNVYEERLHSIEFACVNNFANPHTYFLDFDLDGIVNVFDLDSDDDGIYDLVENGNGALDTDRDGMIDGSVGTNGLPDAVETAPESGAINYTIAESAEDGDNYPNFLDIDADGDGIPDNIEAQTTAAYLPPSGADTDLNGVDDAYDTYGSPLSPVNTDGADLPDYLDANSDNDDFPDIQENNNASNIESGIDADTDGLDDNFDSQLSIWDANDHINDPNPSTLGDADGDVASDGNNAVPMTQDVDFRDASSVITDPGHVAANDQCNDNGTSGDPTDDFITFTLNPTGYNLAADYTVSVPAGYTVTPATAAYGTATTFTLNPGSAGGGDVAIVITDNQAGGDTAQVTITDPGTCSTKSDIIDVGLASVDCNNNGTNGDPTDDYIVFDLTPVGYNLGSDYTVIVPMGYVVTPATGVFGTNTTFHFALQNGSAGGGDVVVLVQDNAPGGDTMSFVLPDPGTCSGESNIIQSGLQNITCQDNGTPQNIYDDYITFALDPFGYNLDSAYSVVLQNGDSIVPQGGLYGDTTVFSAAPGTAGGGDLSLWIIDNQPGGDSLEVLITDPGYCSIKPDIIVVDTIVVNVDTVQYCVDTSLLPAPFSGMTNVCPASSGAYVYFDLDTKGFCVNYYGVDFTGTDTLCLEVTDTQGHTDTIRFFITVIPPLAGLCLSDSIFINEAANVCLDTSELAGPIVSVQNICEDSTVAKFAIDSALCVTYEGRELGQAQACFVLTNDLGITDTVNFCVDVIPYDGLPDAAPDSFCVLMNTPGIFNLLANDNTLGGVDSFYIVQNPLYGDITINPDLSITYRPKDEICERTDLVVYGFCNPNGCVEEQAVICIECQDIQIFTAVSPNGDGVNDVFYISNIENYPQSVLEIYNRWGNLVYHRTGYQNDWNGMWRNNRLPDGTYYYVLKLNDEENRLFSGYLQLFR